MSKKSQYISDIGEMEILEDLSVKSKNLILSCSKILAFEWIIKFILSCFRLRKDLEQHGL